MQFAENSPEHTERKRESAVDSWNELARILHTMITDGRAHHGQRENVANAAAEAHNYQTARTVNKMNRTRKITVEIDDTK